MTDQNLKQLKHTFGSYKLAEEFYFAVCSFFYQMDINGQIFIDSFIKSYVKHVDSKSKRLGDVILDTGFTKTMVQNSLKGVKNSKQFTTKSFYVEMVEEVKKICMRREDLTMKIKGSPNSFTSIFYRLEPPSKQLSSQSFLAHIIKRGILCKIDDNTIQFITSMTSKHVNTKEKCLNTFTLILERLTHTLIRNHKALNDDEQNFQHTYRSIHIDPSDHDAVRFDLRKLVRKHWLEYQALIDSYEVKTEFKKNRVEQTGAELGISTFIYNINPDEE